MSFQKPTQQKNVATKRRDGVRTKKDLHSSSSKRFVFFYFFFENNLKKFFLV